jgi:hypothetical protein
LWETCILRRHPLHGIHVAQVEGGATLLLSQSAEWGAEEALRMMTNLRQKLMAVAMAVVMTGLVSFGAFAQRKEDKRPQKPPDTKVVVEPKGKPPQNSNQGDKRNDGKKGKP